MDLRESKDTGEMIATVELPGMTKEDVNIDVHQNRLIVSGQSTMSEEQEEQEGYAVHERRFGRFSRAMPLPSDIEVCNALRVFELCFHDKAHTFYSLFF